MSPAIFASFLEIFVPFSLSFFFSIERIDVIFEAATCVVDGPAHDHEAFDFHDVIPIRAKTSLALARVSEV